MVLYNVVSGFYGRAAAPDTVQTPLFDLGCDWSS